MIPSWRNENMYTAYPLSRSNKVTDPLFLDATLWVPVTPTIKYIEFTADDILVQLDYNNIVFKKSAPYTEYGKIIFNPDYTHGLGTVLIDVPFSSTVCIQVTDLTLQGLSGEVTIQAPILADGNTLQISLEETPEFKYDCVTSVNGVYPPNGNLQIKGDPCTEIRSQRGGIVVNDACLPPCYNCTERITTGDVYQVYAALKARVDNL